MERERGAFKDDFAIRRNEVGRMVATGSPTPAPLVGKSQLLHAVKLDIWPILLTN